MSGGRISPSPDERGSILVLDPLWETLPMGLLFLASSILGHEKFLPWHSLLAEALRTAVPSRMRKLHNDHPVDIEKRKQNC